jgi:hypothetical protein
MQAQPDSQTDPIAFLDKLTVEQLRQRLEDLDAESKAVRVLLRAALARDRASTCRLASPAAEENRRA